MDMDTDQGVDIDSAIASGGRGPRRTSTCRRAVKKKSELYSPTHIA